MPKLEKDAILIQLEQLNKNMEVAISLLLRSLQRDNVGLQLKDVVTLYISGEESEHIVLTGCQEKHGVMHILRRTPIPIPFAEK